MESFPWAFYWPDIAKLFLSQDQGHYYYDILGVDASLLLSKELRLVRWGLCFFCSSLECATVSSRLAFGLALYVLRMNVAIKNTTFFCAAKGRCPVAAQYCRHEQKKAKLNEGWNVLFLLAFFRAVRWVSLLRSDDKLFICLPSTKKELSWLHSIRQLLIANNFTHQFITLVISTTLFQI